MQNFTDLVQGNFFKIVVEQKRGKKCAFFNDKLAIFRKRWKIRPRLLL